MSALILDDLLLKQTAFNYLIMKKMSTLEAKTWVHRREHELSFPLTALEFLVNTET